MNVTELPSLTCRSLDPNIFALDSEIYLFINLSCTCGLTAILSIYLQLPMFKRVYLYFS